MCNFYGFLLSVRITPLDFKHEVFQFSTQSVLGLLQGVGFAERRLKLLFRFLQTRVQLPLEIVDFFRSDAALATLELLAPILRPEVHKQ